MSSCLVHLGFVICLHGASAAGAPVDVPGDPCDAAQRQVLAAQDLATLIGGLDREHDDAVAAALQWADENLRKQCSAPGDPLPARKVINGKGAA